MSANSIVKPPSRFSAEAKKLWRALMSEYGLENDTAAKALLTSLCETVDRLRECQCAIKRDGLTVTGSTDQIRPHPLLVTEAECRRAILAHYRALKLEPEDF